MNPQVFSQWPNEAGIHQTLYQMKELVNKSFLHPWIRERAGSVASFCNRNRRCEAMTLSDWIRHNVTYISDPNGVEALHDPVSWIESRIRRGEVVYADCDDMAIYLATLLKSIGHEPKFKVIGRDDKLTHVLVVSDGLNLDPSVPLGTDYRQARRNLVMDI